jgi:hypothetical protein
VRRAPVWMAIVCAIGLCLVAANACHPFGPDPPACAPEQLASIESAFVAEAVQACAGRTKDNCPALPSIEQKYRDKREEWIQCRR